MLSLISFGMEFHSLAPSYIKLFFILLVRGCGKQRLPEIFLRLYIVLSFLQWKSFVRDSGPILFRVLYIILAFAFFLVISSGSQPKICNRMIYTIAHARNNSSSSILELLQSFRLCFTKYISNFTTLIEIRTYDGIAYRNKCTSFSNKWFDTT